MLSTATALLTLAGCSPMERPIRSETPGTATATPPSETSATPTGSPSDSGTTAADTGTGTPAAPACYGTRQALSQWEVVAYPLVPGTSASLVQAFTPAGVGGTGSPGVAFLKGFAWFDGMWWGCHDIDGLYALDPATGEFFLVGPACHSLVHLPGELVIRHDRDTSSYHHYSSAADILAGTSTAVVQYPWYPDDTNVASDGTTVWSGNHSPQSLEVTVLATLESKELPLEGYDGITLGTDDFDGALMILANGQSTPNNQVALVRFDVLYGTELSRLGWSNWPAELYGGLWCGMP